MIVSTLAAAGLARCVFLRAFRFALDCFLVSFWRLSRGLHRAAVVVDLGEFAAARRGELRLERLVRRVLRIERIKGRANVGALGKLA